MTPDPSKAVCGPSYGFPRELWLEPDKETGNATARELCQGCPERVPCLTGAVARREPWGIWGGESFFPKMIGGSYRRGHNPLG